jgi:hypothetical protein
LTFRRMPGTVRGAQQLMHRRGWRCVDQRKRGVAFRSRTRHEKSQLLLINATARRGGGEEKTWACAIGAGCSFR